MKKKRIIIIIAVVLIIIALVLGLLLNHDKPKPVVIDEEYNNQIKSIINMINDKKTFNIYFYSKDSNSLENVLNYYKDIFSIEYESLEMNFDNDIYKSLVDKLDVDISSRDELAFVVIKDGSVDYSINGLFSENNLRNLLIQAKLIDPLYKTIDYLFNDDEFEKYYSSGELYSILYINSDNKDLYEYRKIFLENKEKSLILYSERLDSIKTSVSFEEEFNILDETTEKLPILIKIKNNKVVSKEYNVSLDNFAEKIKSM